MSPTSDGKKYITDWLWELYPVFLNAGYNSFLFWDSGLDEVLDLIESRERQKKAEMQTQAVLNLVQAKQISEYIYAFLEPDKSKVKITELSTYFPELFSDAAETESKQQISSKLALKQQISNELALNKAKMEEFAYWHNRKRKGR